MLKELYKFVLAVNSTILLLVVFLINNNIAIPFWYFKEQLISNLSYVVFCVLFSALCLWFTRFLSCEMIEGGVVGIELANNSYLPSYLGYFFVALGITDVDVLIWVFLIILVFTFNSRTLYFNPMFLLFGYKFYYLMLENGMKIFVISKENITNTQNLTFENIVRINDYTFVDRRRKNK